MLFEARGQIREAEAAYSLGEQRRRAAIKPILGSENPPSESQLLQAVDITIISQARMKARQGRLAEAEVDARRALLSRLKDHGKYNPRRRATSWRWPDILIEQGRYAEAEKLTRACLEIQRTVGVADDTQFQRAAAVAARRRCSTCSARPRSQCGVRPDRQGDRQLGAGTPAGTRTQRSRISAVRFGPVEAGIAAAEQLVKRRSRGSARRISTPPSARGTLAVGLMPGRPRRRGHRASSRRRSR